MDDFEVDIAEEIEEEILDIVERYGVQGYYVEAIAGVAWAAADSASAGIEHGSKEFFGRLFANALLDFETVH